MERSYVMTKPNDITNKYDVSMIRPSETTTNLIVRLIVTNPWLILIVLGFMIILIVYFISSANTYLTQLVDQYSSLSAKVSDSKAQYDKKLFYLTENLDGTVSVTIGFRSEEEQRQAEEAAEEATSPTAPTQSIQLSADAQAVEDLLATQPEFAAKAHALAAVYDKVNGVYGTNATIGFMANIAAEGSFGQVEQSFSFASGRRQYGFNMPSEGDHIKTKEDVEYLRYTWPASYSTGFGMVQWSFGRRHNLCDAYLSRLADKPSSYQIPPEIMEEVEVNFFYTESLEDMESIEGGVARTSDTPENWAEAVCDYYERPSGCCDSSIKMSGTGSSCDTRRGIATRLKSLLATLQ